MPSPAELKPLPFTTIPSPAQALWNQRQRIAASLERIQALNRAVNRPSELALYQWAQIIAFALEFQPDLIIELGRLFGNSTSCFLEVAHQLKGSRACRVVSLCLSDEWFHTTVPRLKSLVPKDWFAPGEILQRNILHHDFSTRLENTQRCLVFWDAHGFDVAECVLGNLLPQLVKKPHVILMHDLSDLRYDSAPPEYGEMGLWKGADSGELSFWLGHIFSRVAQAVSIVDFVSRNQLPLHSAAESFHQELATDPVKLATLRQMLGEELFSLQAHWFWFTLNEARGKPTFPHYIPPEKRGDRDAELQVRVQRIQEEVESLRQTLEKEAPQINVDGLLVALRAHEEELAWMREEKQELEALWKAVENSAGWRLLNRWRSLRDRWAPVGTLRRRLYDFLLRGLRDPG
jgi:hypothetical protein